ncbi:MAG: GNAT family N-acetyltransferase [Sulfurimonas sp.]|nr:GNAT family N-acetyltransferase [Sulfurimonas sp.]MBU3938241.1 GNAT family N-acetyltransferase [bacterium]MBU4023741.1 GNAT family N-acetyltransferase [bacterium]MBU4058949.1 GNAT family N-acetyltransferase [bacterium]MBU4110098.1 GNAT family N-acetyltransferase [bacterium]
MQIRELTLKELETAYGVVCQLREHLSYKEFEDLIYDMRHIEYKMFGIFERGELISYAGVSVSTNLTYKRHLVVHDFVTDINYRNNGYKHMMYEYLRDYAKTCMCENIVLIKEMQEENEYICNGKNFFKKESCLFVEKI